MAKPPLEGTRILDFSQVWAEPSLHVDACLRALTIKVEA
jgi:hypothetical protein